MKASKLRIALLLCLSSVLLGLLLFLVNRSGESRNHENVYGLRPPPFVGVASAAELGGLADIENEAGMSAYFQASTAISLDDVRDAFRTIEEETSEYIIGSVPVTGYPESQDVHVYVHVDGWVLAYYLAADPVGKIPNWRLYHETGRTDITTKLENTLAVVAGEAGASYTGATHYDFRYPNATHLMLIVEWAGPYQVDPCEVSLPGSFAFYERSWSLGANVIATYFLDGVEIASTQGWSATKQGVLTATQLLPDQFHTITIDADGYEGYGYGGLVLVYRIP